MIYGAAVDYLYSLQKHGIKLRLENTQKLLALVGNPQKKFRSIHIAGTNGKGSVSSMSASILRAYGFRTGLFTSPHLINFTERIKVDNLEISESDVVALTEEISSIMAAADERLNPTFFEFVTAMAFIHFERSGVEWAVIETGMGGRLDATNILIPEVSVITTISYDHWEFLGRTLGEISAEKAGIIKAGVPVISAPQCDEAAAVISRTATENSSALSVYGMDFCSSIISSNLHGSRFDYIDNSLLSGPVRDIFVPLAGEYQVMNASLAIRAVNTALNIPEAKEGIAEGELIRKGIASTRLRGRLEIISAEPPIIIDAAHNAGAAAELAQFIRKYLKDRRIILVLGIMADKDIKGIFEALLPIASDVIFTAPAYERAESPERLAVAAAAAGFENISVAQTVKEALSAAAKKQAASADSMAPVVLITGSFYTIGEALAAAGERSVLGSLRETL
jgi:dihydrofolate synthase / folylpolyglutamate synthase